MALWQLMQLGSTLNVRTPQSISQLPELITNPQKHLIDAICIQEHRLYHENKNLNYHQAGKGWSLINSLS